MTQEYLVSWVSDVVEAPVEILFMGCPAIDAVETACCDSTVCRSAIVVADLLVILHARHDVKSRTCSGQPSSVYPGCRSGEMQAGSGEISAS